MKATTTLALLSTASLLLVTACTTTYESVGSGKPAGSASDPGASPEEGTPEGTGDGEGTTGGGGGEGEGEGEEADGGSTSKDGGGKTPTPPKDGGTTPPSGGGVDRVACTGPASSSGSIYGTTPAPKVGSVITDPSSGGLRLILQPTASVAANDVIVALYFTPIPGQLDYNPTGAVACAVLRYTGSGWAVVDKTQLCELHFAQNQHASAAGVCDGTLAGTWNGVFSGNQPLGGSFVLPSSVAASQISAPSCRPRDSICTTHSQCCSASCSPVLGICQ